MGTYNLTHHPASFFVIEIAPEAEDIIFAPDSSWEEHVTQHCRYRRIRREQPGHLWEVLG